MLEDYYDFLGNYDFLEEKKEEKFVLKLEAHDRSNLSNQNIDRPLWEYVDEGIDRVFSHGGTVKLSFLKPEDAYIEVFVMDALPGRFRLILFTRDEDRKKRVQSWWEPGDPPFRGVTRFTYDDDWDDRTICKDLSVAKKVFLDLFENGEISQENMADFR